MELKKKLPFITLGILFLLMVVVLYHSDPFRLLKHEAMSYSEENYRIYHGDGSPATLEIMLEEISSTSVTFLGESHNDPVAHYLEMLIFSSVWQPGFALSLEMFESDVQYVLDEYLNDMISEKHLMSSARVWKNYELDYKPLIEFSRENNVDVIAANAPRRYVNMVSRNGLESLASLSKVAIENLPPLPYPKASPEYADKFRSLMSKNEPSQIEEEETQKGLEEKALKLERSLLAQSLWDASMAWSIVKYQAKHANSQVVHLNGSFHSAERKGIPDHIQNYNPQTSMLVVTIIASETFPDFESENMLNQGDFVIVTDASLPRSYRSN